MNNRHTVSFPNELIAVRGSMLYDHYLRRSAAADRKRARRLAGIRTAADAAAYIAEIREKLHLSFGEIPPIRPISPQVTGTLETAKLRIDKVVFQSRPGFFVTALFYRGKNIDSPVPGILFLCGHNTLRALTMKDQSHPASRSETAAMRALLEEALEQGAAGFSIGLWYYSGIYSKTEEAAEIAGALRGTGKPCAAHIRSEGDTLLESIEEACTIAQAGDGILQLSHFKTMERANWHKLSAAFELLEKKRAEGLRIAGDRYPYLYAGTGFRMCMPAPYSQMSCEEAHRLLWNDPAERRRLADRVASFEPSCTWDRVILANSPAPEHAPYLGRTVREIAALRGCSIGEVCAWILAGSEEPIAMTGTMCAENLDRILAQDWIMPGSDAGIQSFGVSSGHPRKFGTMARFFRMACAHMPAERVIRRMTALPAETFGLKNRGVIRPGAHADLVLFRKNELNAEEDYAHPAVPAKGIRRVYVNGILSYEPGMPSPGRAGVFIPVRNQGE